MKKSLSSLSLFTLLTLAGVQIAVAEAALGQAVPKLSNSPARNTATEWTAQLEASPVQITNVRLEDTETGLQVVLETADGELAAPTTTVSGDALIAKIPNAVLALDEFQQFEPTEGIALVQVTELPDNRVQVVITGADAAPTAEVSTAANGLTLSIAPGVARGESDETLRLVVTGEEGSRYFEPDTSTATRTDTPLRDTPQSIQVVPREVLEDQQVITLGDALRNVSGVVRSEQIFNGEQFIIRGFNGSTTLRDGFRLNDGGRVGFLELSNLETIEVLKGPASILAGSINPGGAINLVTKQPLSEPFYNLEFQADNRGLISPSIDLSGPLTADSRLRYRLNALYRNQDSFRGYDTDIERGFVAPTVSWQIGDRTDLTVYLEYLDDERPGDDGLIALGDEVADVPSDLVIGELDDIAREETLRVAYQFEHRFSDTDCVQACQRWKLRNGFSFFRSDLSSELTSAISVLDDTTGDVLLVSAFDSDVETAFDLQTNVVGEFNTGSIEHRVLVGVDLFRNVLDDRDLRVDFFSPIPFNVFDPVYGTVPRPDREDTPILALQDIRDDGLGIYLQDQVTLLDNLKLLAGVRYDTIEQEVTSSPTFSNPNSSESTINEDAFTPRVGLVYQPIEEVSLYGSYSTSFLPNTATTVEGELIKPERGEQFEIGARAELLEGRLTANLALFDITKENVATADPDNFGFSIATGEQRSRGVELDIAGEILPGWNIIANYAYTDAEITSDNSENEGNRLSGVPENNVNLWTTYDIQNGPLEGLGFGLGVNYVSERFGDVANSFTADEYFLTNAAISYKRDNWRAALNIRNLFDVDYIESAGRTRTIGIGPGEPFTLIGSFSIEF
ncbi:MAG: TonB-dependent siderophore receptor [Cyanobacteria bacterium P01_C01_bin.120]